MEYLNKIEKDIKNYNNSFDTRKRELTKRSFSPNTRKNRIHTIKNLLGWNHIELSKNSGLILGEKTKIQLCSLMIFHKHENKYKNL